MGFVNPAVIFLTVCIIAFVNGQVPLVPKTCPASNGFTSSIDTYCLAGLYGAVVAPNFLNANGQTATYSVPYGKTVVITDVLPYQIYTVNYACVQFLRPFLSYVDPTNPSALIYIADFGTDTLNACSGQNCAFNGDSQNVFSFKTNSALITKVAIEFYYNVDYAANNNAFPGTCTGISSPGSISLTIGLGETCNAGNLPTATQHALEPNTDYSNFGGVAGQKILPDTSYTNNFFGCPYSYDIPSSSKFLQWTIDGSGSGYKGISIRFLDFDLLNQGAYLYIYQGNVATSTSKVYSFTGLIPPGSEEVYIESNIVIVQLVSSDPSTDSGELFSGFTAVYNWNSPCKDYSPKVNNYVSYFPFDHLGCVGGIPSAITTINFYYFPLDLYASTTKKINPVFVDFAIPSGNSVSICKITFTSISAAPSTTQIGTTNNGNAPPSLTLPTLNLFPVGVFALFQYSSGSAVKGYGFSIDVGYTETTKNNLCSAGGAFISPSLYFSFVYETPTSGGNVDCANANINSDGYVYYLLRPTVNSLGENNIKFSFEYTLPATTVSIYDGPSLQSNLLTSTTGNSGTITDESTQTELLFQFHNHCPGACAPSSFTLTYTLGNDLCKSSGRSLNQSPLATLGCPQGIPQSVNSYWLITGEALTRNTVQRGIITISFTFFDIGNNKLNIFDGDSVYTYLNDGSIDPLNFVGQFSGNTLPAAYETSQPELLLELLLTTETAYGFVAVYTIWNGQNPCASSASLTVYTPTGTIFCDNAVDSGNVQVESQWFINPNNGIIDLGVNYFYFSGTNAVDASLSFFGGSEDTDVQLGLLTPVDGDYYYSDTYGKNKPSTFNYKSQVMLVKFQSSSNPSFFSLDYATTQINCPIAKSTVLTDFDGEFGCYGLAAFASQEYLINPQFNADSITLDFLYFKLQKGEVFLKIYDGTDATSGILRYTFTGHTIPPQIVSRSTSLFIVVDATQTASVSGGFLIHYYTQSFCNTNKVIKVTAPTNNIACLPLGNLVTSSVLIEPGLGPITFSWNILNFNGGWVLYDGATSDAPILGGGYGNSLTNVLPIPQHYVSNNRALLLTFQNDVSETKRATSSTPPSFGFSFTYTTLKRTVQYAEFMESESVSLFGTSGSGGNANWVPGVTSEYYIAPSTHGRITLKIETLNLHSDDVVLVYDGPSQEYPLVFTATVGATSPVTLPNSNSESMLIIVSIAASSIGSSFTFSYKTLNNPCTTNTDVILINHFGVFGCPNGIANSISSTWTIQPANGPVVLQFLYFALEAPNDILTLYDGYSVTSGTLLGTFSGLNLAAIPVFTSTLDSFFVKVDTSIATISNGFLAKWSTTDPCFIEDSAVVLTANTGTFGCVNGVNNNIRSTWLISPNNGTIILQFLTVSLSTEIVGGVYPNNIVVYDGPDDSYPVLATITGTNIVSQPLAITSTSNYLFVVLTTGNNIVRTGGFIASYTAIGVNNICQNDGTLTLTSSIGNIQCDPFASNIVSYWFITPLDGSITFTAGTFTPFTFASTSDSLKFYDGYSQNSPVLFTLDSTHLTVPTDATATSTSPVVLVVLTTSGSRKRLPQSNAGRFSVGYHTAGTPCTLSKDVTLTAFSGTISCSNIGNNIDSSYTINPTGPNGPITIQFAQFNLAPGDFLSIIDGSDETDPVTFKYTGSTLPPTFVSQTATVVIRVQTDDSVKSIGFSLSYIASVDPCLSSTHIVYTDVTRIFGCPNGVAAGVDSTWLITPSSGQSVDFSVLQYAKLGSGSYIRIYQGSSASGQPFLSLDSNTNLPIVFNQNTNSTSVFVVLHTPTAAQAPAGSFSFLYASGNNDGCLVSGNTILEQQMGSFGCPTFIENNIDSTWYIQPYPATSTAKITLVVTLFTKWDGSSPSGLYDYITVSDSITGPISPSPIDLLDTTYTFTSGAGSTLVVYLHTDLDVRSNGFFASYATDSTDVCLLTLAPQMLTATSTAQEINCGPLGNNVTNSITINSVPSTRIQLTPITIITELNADLIIIYDGSTESAPELARYSGVIINGPPVTTTSNVALVVISTDLEIPSQKLELQYKAVSFDPCQLTSTIEYTGASGRFGCSKIVPPNQSTFNINPTLNSNDVVYLYFEDLYIPPGQGTIKIYNGNSATGTPIAVATGTSHPAPIVSLPKQGLFVVLDIYQQSAFFASYITIPDYASTFTPIKVVSVSPTIPFVPPVPSPDRPDGGDDPEPTPQPSSTPTAVVRATSVSPQPEPSFAEIPSFKPFVPATITPTISLSVTKSPTPSISLSYTETRTSTATPAATPLASRSAEFFNVRTRFNCLKSVSQCCSDFGTFWAALSALNAPQLISSNLCQAITSRDTLVEVVFEQFGSNFHTVNSILDDYWAQSGCGNQDPLSDGVCVPSTDSLASADWDNVYLIEVIQEDQYTTDLNTSAAVETTYNPIDSTAQPVFTSSASSLVYSFTILFLMFTLF